MTAGLIHKFNSYIPSGLEDWGSNLVFVWPSSEGSEEDELSPAMGISWKDGGGTDVPILESSANRNRVAQWNPRLTFLHWGLTVP